MELIFKKADIDDLETLVKIRIEVLRAANGLSEDADMSEVERETKTSYRTCLENGRHVTYLVYEGSRFAGCGGVSFYHVLPTYCNPSGKCAYIMNMYTRPEYRRKGIARRTLALLVKEAKERGIRKITLEATTMGRPLYESCGFSAMNNEMEWNGAHGI